jgi:DNA end-binding protein Ku
MMAYTLRFQNELRNSGDYFRDIKATVIDQDSLELAETLIKRMSTRFDLSKFEDGYEIAVKALVEAKVNNMPVPVDEAPKHQPAKVVNLMDALRKSISQDAALGKKPPKSEKEAPGKKIGLVKTQPKTAAKRKTA